MNYAMNDQGVSLKTKDTPAVTGSQLEHAITGFVSGQRARFEAARQLAEQRWREAWALYIGSPEAMDDLRAQVLHTVGDVNVDWRHKINVGKAYEAVETIHGYLMSATFPNRDWFTVVPEAPADLKQASLVQKFILKKLDEGLFRSHYQNFLRQLIITGNSVLALPWRYETRKWKKRVKVAKPKEEVINLDAKQYEWVVVEEDRIIQNNFDFETLDIFDVFFDTTVPDVRLSPLLRRLHKTKAEVIECIRNGYYLPVEEKIVLGTGIKEESNKLSKNIYMGVTPPPPTSEAGNDYCTLWEYWGDVQVDGTTYKDMVVTILGDNILLRFEPNPFWGGRPFIVGSYTPIMQTYAMGAIQPSAGLLHELNIVTNQRLDNLELSIDQMWTVRADGMLQPEDVYTAPGKVFFVSDHTDIQPLQGNTADYPITYQETGVLEQFIDKNFGTGPLIGGGQPRGGERVTAQEIQAVRDAGGNRLSNVHKHIEETALIPLLANVMEGMRQFVTRDEIVRIPGATPDSYDYFKVGPEEVNNHWRLKPQGADFVADKQKFIQARLDFLAAVTQIPQMATRINYERLLYDLVSHFVFDDPDSYIVDSPAGVPQDPSMLQQPPQGLPPEATQDPMMMAGGGLPTEAAGIEEQLMQMGGRPLQQAVMNDMQTGGMSEVLSKYLSSPTNLQEEG